LAILSTSYAAVPEFIDSGIDGVLVAPEDAPALAAALRQLIGDPARRAALGGAARAKFVHAFSFDAGIAAIAERLDGSIGRGDGASRDLSVPSRPHIGLGGATSIDSLEIRWPGSGLVQRFEGPIAADRTYELREGQAAIREFKPLP